MKWTLPLWRCVCLGLPWLALWRGAPAAALPAVGLDATHGEYAIGSYVEYLEDPQRRWTIDDVVRAPLADHFARRPDSSLNLGLTDSAYWLRFALRNDTTEPARWFLCVDWALNDELDLYAPGSDGAFVVRHAGDARPFGAREIAYRQPLFLVALEPGATRTFFVRVAGGDALLVPLAVRSEGVLWRHNLSETGRLTFFYGACVAMIIYNCTIYLIFRHRGYLYYICFASCTLGWSLCTEGYAHQYSAPWVANRAIHVFGVGIVLSFISAARAFLDSRNHTPRMDRALRLLQIGEVGIVPLSFVEVPLFVLLLVLLGAAQVALLAIISVHRWRQGAPMARLFTLACVPLAAGGLLWGIDSLWPISTSNWVASYVLQLGALTSLVLLPMPLAGRLAFFEELQQRTAELRARTQDLADSERELEAARDKALAGSRAKSTFLANMSHELRTPLNAIIGYSEMVQEDAEEAGHTEYHEDLQKIILSGKHLLGLINDVLDLSKIEAGKVALYAEDFDVGELVRGMAASVEPLIARHANRLEVSVAHDAGTMHSDATRVRQILLNLLSNAAKFTKQGTIRLVVERQSVNGADGLEFSVADTGIGMSPDQLGQIFEAFTQAKPSTARDYGGTGLGLTITKRFCEMLGGVIDVASEPGRGARFVVRLPRFMPEEVRKVEGDGPAEPSSITVPEGSARTAGKRLVLVIEDNPSARDLMQRALEREGYAVRAAGTGEEGLRLARACRPDVVTLDVVMPRMDGWAVLSALKADPELADVPVIVITIVENRDLGYALGAAEYLVKPVQRERLLGVLARHVPPGERGPVLVVDDEEGARQRLGRAVRDAGYAVVEAENGRVALERMAAQTPWLILLDLLMPVMDGFEFLAALRGRDEWRAIPVVFVTAKDLSEAERVALSGATERVFQKGTCDTASLVAEVSRLIRARNA